MTTWAGKAIEVRESAVTDTELRQLGLAERSKDEDRWLPAVIVELSPDPGTLLLVKIGAGHIYGVPFSCWRPQP